MLPHFACGLWQWSFWARKLALWALLRLVIKVLVKFTFSIISKCFRFKCGSVSLVLCYCANDNITACRRWALPVIISIFIMYVGFRRSDISAKNVAHEGEARCGMTEICPPLGSVSIMPFYGRWLCCAAWRYTAKGSLSNLKFFAGEAVSHVVAASAGISNIAGGGDFKTRRK